MGGILDCLGKDMQRGLMMLSLPPGEEGGAKNGSCRQSRTLGTRGFSRAQRDNISAEGRTTSGEAARKTSGPERYDLPFPLNFDLFYWI